MGVDEIEGIEGEGLYDVVVNEEEQYSIWLVGSPPPSGWKAVGVRGAKQECLDRIAEIWTDLRPRSLRSRPAGRSGEPD